MASMPFPPPASVKQSIGNRQAEIQKAKTACADLDDRLIKLSLHIPQDMPSTSGPSIAQSAQSQKVTVVSLKEQEERLGQSMRDNKQSTYDAVQRIERDIVPELEALLKRGDGRDVAQEMAVSDHHAELVDKLRHLFGFINDGRAASQTKDMPAELRPAASQDLSQMEEALDTQKKQIEDLQLRLDEATAKAIEADRAWKEREARLGNDHAVERANLETTIEDLKNDIITLGKLEAQSNKRCENLEKSLQALTEERDGLASNSQDVGELRQELTDVKYTLRIRDDELESLRDIQTDLAHKNVKLVKSEAEVANLKEQLDSSRRNQEILDTIRTTMDRVVMDMRLDKQHMQERMLKAEEARQATAQEAIVLRAKLELVTQSKVTAIDRLQENLDGAQAQAAGLTAALAESHDELSKSQTSMAAQSKSLEEWQYQVDAMVRKLCDCMTPMAASATATPNWIEVAKIILGAPALPPRMQGTPTAQYMVVPHQAPPEPWEAGQDVPCSLDGIAFALTGLITAEQWASPAALRCVVQLTLILRKPAAGLRTKVNIFATQIGEVAHWAQHQAPTWDSVVGLLLWWQLASVLDREWPMEELVQQAMRSLIGTMLQLDSIVARLPEAILQGQVEDFFETNGVTFRDDALDLSVRLFAATGWSEMLLLDSDSYVVHVLSRDRLSSSVDTMKACIAMPHDSKYNSLYFPIGDAQLEWLLAVV